MVKYWKIPETKDSIMILADFAPLKRNSAISDEKINSIADTMFGY